MTVGLTSDVDGVRVRELPVVSVGGREDRVDQRSPRDRHIGNGYGFAREPFGGGLQRAAVAQQLLHCRPDELRILLQLLDLVGMLEQGQRAVPDEIDRRLVPGNEKEKDHCQKLVLTQLVACFFDLNQGAHEIVLRPGAARLHELADVAQEHHGARDGSDHSPARRIGLDDDAGPAMELVAILDRNTEHLRDDRRRYR